MDGEVCVVTGATWGIGKATAIGELQILRSYLFVFK